MSRLPDLERSLRVAAARQDRAAFLKSVPTMPSPPAPGYQPQGIARRSRPGARQLLLAGLALLVLAAPAAAILQPWDPQASRPGIDPPITSTHTPVVASATDVLAVLRRPQTAADRSAATPLIKTVGAGG
jgi:hypothetical protein